MASKIAWTDESWNPALLGFQVETVGLGSPFCVSEWMQVRFPRSKRRRIRKKWCKDRRNWKRVPTGDVYQLGGTIYMHPDVLKRLKQKIARQNDDRISANKGESSGDR